MTPVFSIITVSYQSEKTIKSTIESVLAQSYAHIEYLIIDGASKDETVAIAEGYRDAFEQKGYTYRIVSEPDGGIYDAMNKGIRLATGDYIGIINSDDWYEADAVEKACACLQKEHCDISVGYIRMHKTDGTNFVKRAKLAKLQTSRNWNHPTMFVKAEVYKEHPFLQKGIHDDYGFYLARVKAGADIRIIPQVLANFRMGGVSNARSMKACRKRIQDRYQWCYRVNGYSRLYMIECVLIEVAKYVLG
ncbi:MAG: glycosyltransferase family 2 protein [Lachnospiraceae bacterium]